MGDETVDGGQRAPVARREKAMTSRAIGVLIIAAGMVGWGPAYAQVSHSHHNHTVTVTGNYGPLNFTNPPVRNVVNLGTIKSVFSGTPALKTTGSITIVNNGTITAIVRSGTNAMAVGISQH
jgi:hypothetical protein